MKQQPVEILITNDDGYTSKGINFLANLLEEYGNVTVVAPEVVQSGMSAALSMGRTLRLEKKSQTVGNHGNSITVYSLTGTPVDCIKMAMNKFFKAGGSETVEQDPTDRGYKPHIIFSGINHGSNAAVNVLYSGTMGAAIETTFYNIPSIGLSLTDHDLDADFEGAIQYGTQIIEAVLSKELPRPLCLNVNIPDIPCCEIKGIRLSRQTRGYWREEFFKRTDPHGREYFWLTGAFSNAEPDAEDTDHWAMNHHYMSVHPCTIDQTAYAEI